MGPGRSAEKMGRHDWLIAALAAAPLVAVALVAVFSIGHGYHGVDDNAMNELRISDIGAHWPAIGPFSRDGWSHPGPMLFYVLAVPYWLTGNHSNGLLVGAALVNAGAVVGMIVLARRRGGSAFVWLVALGCLVLFTSFGLGFFWDPWNPFIPVLPFGCVVLATWCVTCGDVWCMPIVAGVGTFCVQTHVGYAPLVGVLALVAAVGIVATRRPRR